MLLHPPPMLLLFPLPELLALQHPGPGQVRHYSASSFTTGTPASAFSVKSFIFSVLITFLICPASIVVPAPPFLFATDSFLAAISEAVAFLWTLKIKFEKGPKGFLVLESLVQNI